MAIDNVNKDMDKIRMSKAARMVAMSPHCPRELQDKPDWCLNDFVLVKKLGVGGASAVYQGIFKRSGQCFALKLYFKSKLTALNVHQVNREVMIHSQLEHPNIISLYGAFEDKEHVVLVIEYAAKGDLFDLLRNTGGRMKEADVVRRIMWPFLSALHYLHSLNIIHRDIKLENTLFSSDGSLKIADFGLSVDTTVERPVTRLGTLDYMSPEVMVCPDKRTPAENKSSKQLAYTNKVDTWACGVLAFELLVGCPPFGMSTREGSVKAILYQAPKIPQWLPPAATDFIEWALTKKAHRRPSVLQLLQHSWLMSHMNPHAGLVSAAILPDKLSATPTSTQKAAMRGTTLQRGHIKPHNAYTALPSLGSGHSGSTINNVALDTQTSQAYSIEGGMSIPQLALASIDSNATLSHMLPSASSSLAPTSYRSLDPWSAATVPSTSSALTSRTTPRTPQTPHRPHSGPYAHQQMDSRHEPCSESPHQFHPYGHAMSPPTSGAMGGAQAATAAWVSAATQEQLTSLCSSYRHSGAAPSSAGGGDSFLSPLLSSIPETVEQQRGPDDEQWLSDAMASNSRQLAGLQLQHQLQQDSASMDASSSRTFTTQSAAAAASLSAARSYWDSCGKSQRTPTPELPLDSPPRSAVTSRTASEVASLGRQASLSPSRVPHSSNCSTAAAQSWSENVHCSSSRHGATSGSETIDQTPEHGRSTLDSMMEDLVRHHGAAMAARAQPPNYAPSGMMTPQQAQQMWEAGGMHLGARGACVDSEMRDASPTESNRASFQKRM